MTPGWKTTEFWMTLSTQAISLLMLLGVISQADQTKIASMAFGTVQSVAAVIANVVVVRQYIADRVKLKSGKDPTSAASG